MPVKKIQTQNEKVIDYQYIRNLKNREVRKSRFKRTLSQRALRIILICILAVQGVYVGYHGLQALKSSSWFFLNQIEVTGTHKTKPEEVEKYIRTGQQNAVFADLTHIKLGLENHPWIQECRNMAGAAGNDTCSYYRTTPNRIGVVGKFVSCRCRWPGYRYF